MINVRGQLTENEKMALYAFSPLIFIVRSSFSMNNFNISTDYKVRGDSNMFVYPVFIQDKTILFSDVNFRMQGSVMVSYHPLNLHIENVEIDFAIAAGGFEINALCGYPDAAMDGLIYIQNFTLYFGAERENYSFRHWTFRYYGPARIEATNLRLETYFSYYELIASFYFRSDKN